MPTATKITGESFGYRASGIITIANATKLKTATLTPVDADLHDISKEGLLITSVCWRANIPNQNIQAFFAIFNRTNNIDPLAHNLAAAWRDSIAKITAGAAFVETSPALLRDTAILPGGGVPLIADFVALSVETDVNVTAATDVYYDIYYKWIPINPDDYRKILYARSI